MRNTPKLQPYLDTINKLLLDKRGIKTKTLTYSLVARMLFDIGMLKYVRPDHLWAINNKYKQICSLKKLQYLASKNFIQFKQRVVFSLSDVGLSFLELSGYPHRVLPSVEGLGKDNEMFNTDVFVKLLTKFRKAYEVYFCYPSFNEFRPDGLMILKDSERVKLIFIEAENEKDDWHNWIGGKLEHYIEYAKLEYTYNVVRPFLNELEIKIPIDKFYFSIWVVTNKEIDVQHPDGFRILTMEEIDEV